MEKKALSRHESAVSETEKARKFVEFYYFWKFHYCTRNYWLELDRIINKGTKQAILTFSDKQNNIFKKNLFLASIKPYEAKICR